MNQTKGKISVAISIIMALSDIERQCSENGVTNSFTWFTFSTRLRAYIGDSYSPSDEVIKVRMRKIQAHGYLNRKDGTRTFIAYQRGNNGVYRFRMHRLPF